MKTIQNFNEEKSKSENQKLPILLSDLIPNLNHNNNYLVSEQQNSKLKMQMCFKIPLVLVKKAICVNSPKQSPMNIGNHIFNTLPTPRSHNNTQNNFSSKIISCNSPKAKFSTSIPKNDKINTKNDVIKLNEENKVNNENIIDVLNENRIRITKKGINKNVKLQKYNSDRFEKMICDQSCGINAEELRLNIGNLGSNTRTNLMTKSTLFERNGQSSSRKKSKDIHSLRNTKFKSLEGISLLNSPVSDIKHREIILEHQAQSRRTITSFKRKPLQYSELKTNTLIANEKEQEQEDQQNFLLTTSKYFYKMKGKNPTCSKSIGINTTNRIILTKQKSEISLGSDKTPTNLDFQKDSLLDFKNFNYLNHKPNEIRHKSIPCKTTLTEYDSNTTHSILKCGNNNTDNIINFDSTSSLKQRLHTMIKKKKPFKDLHHAKRKSRPSDGTNKISVEKALEVIPEDASKLTIYKQRINELNICDTQVVNPSTANFNQGFEEINTNHEEEPLCLSSRNNRENTFFGRYFSKTNDVTPNASYLYSHYKTDLMTIKDPDSLFSTQNSLINNDKKERFILYSKTKINQKSNPQDESLTILPVKLINPTLTRQNTSSSSKLKTQNNGKSTIKENKTPIKSAKKEILLRKKIIIGIGITSASLLSTLFQLEKCLHIFHLIRDKIAQKGEIPNLANASSGNSSVFIGTLGTYNKLKNQLISKPTPLLNVESANAYSNIISNQDDPSIITYIQLHYGNPKLTQIIQDIKHKSREANRKFSMDTTWLGNIEIVTSPKDAVLNVNEEQIFLNADSHKKLIYENMLLNNVEPYPNQVGSIQWHMKTIIKSVLNVFSSIFGISKFLNYSFSERGFNLNFKVFVYGELRYDAVKNLFEFGKIEFISHESTQLMRFLKLRFAKHLLFGLISAYAFIKAYTWMEKNSKKLFIWRNRRYNKIQIQANTLNLMHNNDITEENSPNRQGKKPFLVHSNYIHVSNDTIKDYVFCTCKKYIKNLVLFPCLHVTQCFHCYIQHPQYKCSICNCNVIKYIVLRYG